MGDYEQDIHTYNCKYYDDLNNIEWAPSKSTPLYSIDLNQVEKAEEELGEEMHKDGKKKRKKKKNISIEEFMNVSLACACCC